MEIVSNRERAPNAELTEREADVGDNGEHAYTNFLAE